MTEQLQRVGLGGVGLQVVCREVARQHGLCRVTSCQSLWLWNSLLCERQLVECQLIVVAPCGFCVCP